MARQKRGAPQSQEGGVSRREFLSTAGMGVIGLASGGTQPAEVAVPDPQIAAGEKVALTLRVNGREHRLLVAPRWNLTHVLREELALTGTKLGCERGECGSCTVLIDGVPRYACMTLALEAEGQEITTVEGLLDGENLGPVQQAFAEHDAFQCGYCTPGQIMAVEGLLRNNPNPTLDEIRLGVSGNLCRCGAYPNIFKAAKRASELKLNGGGS